MIAIVVMRNKEQKTQEKTSAKVTWTMMKRNEFGLKNRTKNRINVDFANI